MERSLFSARYCFVEQMENNGILHQGQYNVLKEWYNYIMETFEMRADLIIYIRTCPEVVYERMKKRGRSEESLVSLKFLQQLHLLHENWLIQGRFHRPGPVFIIDGNQDLNAMQKEYLRIEKHLKLK
jgi:deoxyadenosine/deoxycytidine kinase